MLLITRVVKDTAAHVRLMKEVHACYARASVTYRLPEKLHVEFVDAKEGEGGHVGGEYYITVPYEYSNKLSVLKWFVAHELTHVWQAYNGVKATRTNLPHDADFYKALKVLCPKSAIHWELRYRPDKARKHGISRRLRKR